MAVAAARRFGRRAHNFVAGVRRFARRPLRDGDGSAALTREASAWRRPTAMTLCTLIGAAVLAAAWSAAAATHPTPPVRDALRATRRPIEPARSTQTTRAIRTTEAVRPARKATSPAAVRVAVVDTGVTPVSTLSSRVLAGADFVDGDGTTRDRNGHGTAMASIVGDVCDACAIVPVRALGDSGLGTTDLAAQAVRWAAGDGVRVINLSLTARGADDALTSAIENAVAAGVVVVVAAGNSGSTDPTAEGYPGAAAADALTIAAVDPSSQLYSWSNHGSWVQLAAPGSLPVLTTVGKTVNAVGTSSSAAYVSGLAGMLLACNPSLVPAQVRSILLQTAAPIAGLTGGAVDPQAALAAATPAGGCIRS